MIIVDLHVISYVIVSSMDTVQLFYVISLMKTNILVDKSSLSKFVQLKFIYIA